MKSLEEVVSGIDTLEPLPQTAVRLSRVIADGRSTVDDVVAVIRLDEAITTEVLKIANSTFSASQRTIGTLYEAVIRLGGGRILSILMCKKVSGMMRQPLPLYGLSESDLWYHSAAAALAAEHLGARASIPDRGLGFTAALLHDIGKLIIVRFASNHELQAIMECLHRSTVSWATAEQEVFGFTHADIGAAVAHRWNLPEGIEHAIAFHHAITKTHDILTDSTRIANSVARSIGKGLGYEGMSFTLDSTLMDRFNLTAEQYEALCAWTAVQTTVFLRQYSGGFEQ